MSYFKSVKRRTGFETLEAKKLFAADLMGSADASTDTGLVADFDPGDLVDEISLIERWENPSNGQACINESSNASNIVDQAFSSPLSGQDSVVGSHPGDMIADHLLTTNLMNTSLSDHIMNTNLPDHVMNTKINPADQTM